MSETSSVEADSLSAKVYATLRNGILSGAYEPGQRLSLRKIAAEVGVSMAPVSEALHRLNHDGLVEMEPGWGARVASYDPSLTRDQFILRTALECEAARQCVERASDEQLAELLAHAERLDAMIMAGEKPETSRELDLQFHLAIAEMSRVTSLVTALKRSQLGLMLARTNAIAASGVKPAVDAVMHATVVEALQSRDPDEAAHVIRGHCLQAMRAVLAEWLG